VNDVHRAKLLTDLLDRISRARRAPDGSLPASMAEPAGLTTAFPREGVTDITFEPLPGDVEGSEFRATQVSELAEAHDSVEEPTPVSLAALPVEITPVAFDEHPAPPNDEITFDEFPAPPALDIVFDDVSRTEVSDLANESHASMSSMLETPTDVSELLVHGVAADREPLETPTDVTELHEDRAADHVEEPPLELAGAVSQARPISGDYREELDHEAADVRVGLDDEVGADGRGSAFDDEGEGVLETPVPPSGDAELPTNPPFGMAGDQVIAFAPPSALPKDLMLDAEVVDALPPEFALAESMSDEPPVREVPPAEESRIVARELEVPPLRPLVMRPSFDDAFDIVAYEGEVEAASADAFGDVLDAALALG